MLRFNDGVNIETSGKLRTVKKHDGWYVVGKGKCIPVDSQKEGQELIYDLEYDQMDHPTDEEIEETLAEDDNCPL